MMENMVLSMDNSDSVKENKTFVFVNNNNNNTTVTNTTTSATTMPTSTTVGTVKSKSGGGSLKRSRAAADSSSTPPELMRCKRRINFAQLGYSLPQAPPSSVARRNERERNRVKLVNLGFATLREHVPNGSKNKKMSKVETLRSAVEYIRKLQELLDDTDGALQDLFAVDSASSAGSPSQQSSENMMPMSNATSAVNTNSLPGLCYHQNRNGVSANGGAPVGLTGSGNSGSGGIVTCPPSSVSPACSAASSPTPSYASDCSYEPLSPEEEELLDFTSWFT